MRKYLDDIGVTDRPDTWCAGKNDPRKMSWNEQRDTYGFDFRELWNLDYTFYLWLYEHLMAYKEQSSVYIDLSTKQYDYNGKMVSQMDLIDMMLDRLRFSFSDKYHEDNADQYAYVHETEKIWAFILPAMWN